jgi:hypothetical protein
MVNHGVEAVDGAAGVLHEMLRQAGTVKHSGVEPPITKSILNGLEHKFTSFQGNEQDPKKFSQYAIIETAARDIFNDLLVRTMRRLALDLWLIFH